jgi:cytochrome c
MRRLLPLLLAPAMALLLAAAWATNQATPDDAKAMAIKAAGYLTSVGPEKAFPEFNAKDGPWHDRELYVVALDGNGVMVVNGALPGMIGKPMLTLKDVNGKEFNREMVDIKDQGWVRFTWRNPLTNAMQLKAQYIVRVGEYVVGVGAYVEKPAE